MPAEQEPLPAPQLMTYRQAAAVLNVSEWLVKSLAARGELKVARIGGCVRIHRDELERFMLAAEERRR